MDNLEIRYTEPNDLQYLTTWMKDKDILKWFPFSNDKETEMSLKNWIGFSKYRSSLTSLINDEVVSIGTIFLMPYKKISHLGMFYLVVKKEHQKKGIGSEMLKNLLHLSKNYFKLESLFVEVYEECPIILVLKKFNFEEAFSQKRYVKEENKYLARKLFNIWFT